MAAKSEFDLPRPRRRAVLSLAPLIDITFILLIFFMLVTQFERYAPVDVTLGSDRDQPAETIDQGQGIIRQLTIEIGDDNSILYKGQAVALSGLSEILLTKRDNEFVRGVLVKPDAGVTLQTLIDVLSAVQKVPGLAVRITTPPSAAEKSAQ